MASRSSRALAHLCALAVAASCAPASRLLADWNGYGGNAQHTALSPIASQPLGVIQWQTPVDLAPQYSGDELLIHYGSPMVTAANTVIVPVKTGPSNGFQLSAFDGATGVLKWTQPTDYTIPPNGGPWPHTGWTPSYDPTLAPNGIMYYPGAGGTIYARGQLDSNTVATPAQLAFYGLDNYSASPATFNSNVAITTAITADAQGNIYFGYSTAGVVLPGVNNGQPLTNGIARISANGVGTYFQAKDLQAGGNSAGMTQVATTCAPALSRDGSTVYITMSAGNFNGGRLVALSAATLAPVNSVSLIDPQTGTPAPIPNISTASPMVGPDGDVYMGVFDNSGMSRGWMTHFSADLSIPKPTGAFGWDATASVVPASMVPSYHGSSSYLIMTKYNNYAGIGGDGVNMLAILDPNATQIDNRVGGTGATVMKEILKIAGPTPDLENTGSFPNAVREWCINTAAVDPATDSILVNNEDGKVYRWNLSTNTLTEAVTLTGGLGEAYTPTLIGSDGLVYAVNNATLFAVGAIRAPANWDGSNGSWSDAPRWSSAPTVPNNGTPSTTWYDVTIGSGAVNLDTAISVRTITLGPAATLTGSGSLTLADGGVLNGVSSLTGPLTLTTGTLVVNSTGNAWASVQGGALVIEQTGSTVTSDRVMLTGLSISGVHAIRPNTGTSILQTLTLAGAPGAWTGRLDLASNNLIVSQGANVPDQIRQAANLGTWNGAGGITSSAAQAAATGSTATALAYANGGQFAAGNGQTSFAGQSFLPTDTLIMYTLAGDANMDGSVTFADFLQLQNQYNQVGTNWEGGDFNYDNSTTFADFLILQNNYNKTLPIGPVITPSSNSVPEPSSLLILSSLAIPLFRRARRGVPF